MSAAARRLQTLLPILACFGGGSLYGWSGYLPAVRASFGVSTGTASMVFSLALVSFTFGVLFGPMLIARLPTRLRLAAIAGLAVLSLGLAATSGGFAQFALSYGVCFGFTSGAVYNHAISQATGSSAPTLLVPVSVAAFGFGGAVFGPVHVWLTAYGWGLWSILPALTCLAIVAGLASLITPPPGTKTAAQPAAAPMVRPDKTIAALWFIFAAGSASGLIVLGLASQIVPQGSAGVGLASLAIFLAATGNTLGRLSSAATARHFGPARGIAGALVLSICALASLTVTTAPGIVVGLLFVVAFAYGQVAATMPLLVKSQVSAPAFSASFGWVFTGWGVIGLIGPWSAGWLLDATGTLRPSLIACIVLSALSVWAVLRFAKSD